MSCLLGMKQQLRTSVFQVNTRVHCHQWYIKSRASALTAGFRLASTSNQPSGAPINAKPKKLVDRRKIADNQQSGQISAARKAAELLNSLSNAGKTPKAPIVQRSSPNEYAAEQTIEIDKKELAIQRHIVQNRTKILWPGIWTFLAVSGTFGTLAFLDARYSTTASSSSTELPERSLLPQSWILNPQVIDEGVKAGWNELDKLTVGILVATVGVHIMKKSPLPFWEKLVHITGEKRYTAFTYPFTHSNWGHLSQNMFGLCWFMPGVVHYLDGDLFHAAALFTSVSLLTSYLSHFAFRWGSVKGIPINMGSSGAVAALFGAYCMAYPNEKVWLPSFAILRLDSMVWGVLFACWQLTSMAKTRKGGNRPAFMVHVVSLGLGAAYVYLEGKQNIWKPLTARFAKDEVVV